VVGSGDQRHRRHDLPTAVAFRVLDAGSDGGDIGLVLAGRFAALVLFALLGGVWADRLPRRRVVIGSDVVRCYSCPAYRSSVRRRRAVPPARGRLKRR
jgi:hypothetical protein